MAIELTLTKVGCLVQVQETQGGEQIYVPVKQVTFDIVGNSISMKVGTDADARRYNGMTYDQFDIDGTPPASLADFKTAMGTLLQCSSSSPGTTSGTVLAWEEGIVGSTAGMPGGDPSKLDVQYVNNPNYDPLITYNVPFVILDGQVLQAVSNVGFPTFVFDTVSMQIALYDEVTGADVAWPAGGKVGYFVMIF